MDYWKVANKFLHGWALGAVSGMVTIGFTTGDLPLGPILIFSITSAFLNMSMNMIKHRKKEIKFGDYYYPPHTKIRGRVRAVKR